MNEKKIYNKKRVHTFFSYHIMILYMQIKIVIFQLMVSTVPGEKHDHLPDFLKAVCIQYLVDQ